MIRIQHILKELFRNVYRNPGTTLSGFLSMGLLFLLFDLFWVAAGTSNKFYSELISDLQMEIFASEAAPDSTLPAVEDRLASLPGVSTVEYISKQTAREQLTSLVGIDLLVGYDTINPLPRSYILSFTGDYLTIDGLAGIEQQATAMEGISHAYYSRNWLEKAEQTKGVIRNVGMILGAVILLAVLISTANNMRLMTRARAVGFQQMRLQGAGGLLLAFPFLIEGLILAGLSAAAGWMAIFYAKDHVDFTQIEIIFPSSNDILLFCFAAAILGTLSAFLGIKRFLRL
ncbi:MAG: hypothetical protein JSV52_07230 [Candidatus Zixiibacteriota bacterium]|nr:MAG: hypothetical protein JSV52_07230 [candidate division Zixibacteria bacterium]